jgi:hypothetical protein
MQGNRPENKQENMLALVKFGMPSKPTTPRYLAGPPLSAFQPAGSRATLGDITNNQGQSGDPNISIRGTNTAE